MAGINLAFTMREVSLATPDNGFLENSVKSWNTAILNGSFLANRSFIESEVEKQPEPKKTINVVVTGYSSSVDETDDTPFITASGTTVRPGVAATNFLPIGTRFRIPEVYGEVIFTVEDRMNARYNNKKIVDIWFESKAKAKTFGKQSLEIEII